MLRNRGTQALLALLALNKYGAANAETKDIDMAVLLDPQNNTYAITNTGAGTDGWAANFAQRAITDCPNFELKLTDQPCLNPRIHKKGICDSSPMGETPQPYVVINSATCNSAANVDALQCIEQSAKKYCEELKECCNCSDCCCNPQTWEITGGVIGGLLTCGLSIWACSKGNKNPCNDIPNNLQPDEKEQPLINDAENPSKPITPTMQK